MQWQHELAVVYSITIKMRATMAYFWGISNNQREDYQALESLATPVFSFSGLVKHLMPSLWTNPIQSGGAVLQDLTVYTYL
jgi:hypothetical protein